MGLFRNKHQYLGVDIGTSNLKIVELSKYKGLANLTTYGSINLADDVIRSESKEVEEKIYKSLKRLVKESGAKTSRALASLPGFSVFTTIFKLPQMNKEELSEAIRWEAKRYIPFPLEDIILDWEILESKPSPDSPKGIGESEEREIFLTAVPKTLVKRYSDIFKKAGLDLVGLEPEAVALGRALVDSGEGCVMIVDIGATATEICIIENGFPKLNLSLDTGGNALTRAIAHSLQVSFSRAEQFKKDFGASREKMGGEIPKAIKPVVDTIVEKIRHCLTLFYNQEGGKVAKMILSGGSAKLPGFVNYLSLFIDLKIAIANPWRHIIYPQELSPILAELGPGLAVVVGLALRNLSCL